MVYFLYQFSLCADMLSFQCVYTLVFHRQISQAMLLHEGGHVTFLCTFSTLLSSNMFLAG